MKGIGTSRCLLAVAADVLSRRRPRRAELIPTVRSWMILPFAAGGAGDTFARPLAQALSQSLGQPVGDREYRRRPPRIIGTQVRGAGAGLRLHAADGFQLRWRSARRCRRSGLSADAGIPRLSPSSTRCRWCWSPSEAAGEVRRRADCTRQGATRQAELRLVGRRFDLSPADGASEIHAKIDIQHVPYKSSSQARMDVIAGEPAMMMDALATMQGQIKENQVRAIGRRQPEAHRTAPDIPAIAETVPAIPRPLARLHGAGRTPPEIVNRLQAEIAKVLATPEVKALLSLAGRRAVLRVRPRAFGTFLNDEIDKWGKAIRSAGVPIQE